MQPLVVKGAQGGINSITFLRPSNLHQHFRWGPMFDAVAPVNIRHYKYVLGMGNNGPNPKGNLIRTVEDARVVYNRIMDVKAKYKVTTFAEPLIGIYHTTDVTPAMLEYIGYYATPHMGIKDYPTAHGATTNSGHGVSFCARPEVAKAAAQFKVRQLSHTEDVFDKNGYELPHALREAHAITHRMWKYRDENPDAYLCIEHASTKEAIEFVKADTSGRTVMTVTPQHLLFTKEDLDRLTWRNHLKCMPIVKSEDDRLALVEFATSGDSRVIMGDDTAPHPSKSKIGALDECSSGCWLPHSVALYALAFIRAGAMDERFTKFMSLNGPAWWGLTPPANDDVLTVRAEAVHDIPDPTPVPEHNDVIVPLGWTTEPDRLKIGYAV